MAMKSLSWNSRGIKIVLCVSKQFMCHIITIQYQAKILLSHFFISWTRSRDGTMTDLQLMILLPLSPKYKGLQACTTMPRF